MAIGTGLPISLSTVIAEIGLSANSSLQDCFSNANSAGFNGTYSGSKTRLTNFRGYNHDVTTDTLTISPTSYNESTGNGGSFNITVTSNTTWSVSDNAAWVSFSGNSNSGNDVFSVNISANFGTFRTATLTVTTGEVTRNCSISQSPGSA